LRRRERGAALGLTESVREPLPKATGLNVATDLPLAPSTVWSAIGHLETESWEFC
jgi:hypothetical protein